MVRRRPPIKSTQPSQLINQLTKGNGNGHSPPAQLSKTVKNPSADTNKKIAPISCQAKGPNNGANGNGKGGWLTVNEKIFANEWLIDRNGTRAYKVAYPRVKSDPTAGVLACSMLKKPKVAAYIDKKLKKMAEKAELSQMWVLERYKRLVDYDLSDFFDDDGNLKPLSEIPQKALYAVTGFKNVKTSTVNKRANGGVKEIHTLLQDLKLTDKKTALDSIGKHLGMFAEDNAQRRPIVPIQINVTLTDE